MSANDQALLRQWVHDRDAEAFRILAMRHAAMVYNTSRRILRDPTDAEDVAQECFEALVRAGDKPGAYLGAWLHRVATNLSFTRIEAKRHRKDREDRFAANATPATESYDEDLYAHVDKAIAALPDKLRYPLVAHFLENQTHDAIAESIGVSRQTITYRIGQAVEQVRSTLKRRGVMVAAAAFSEFLLANSSEAVPSRLVANLGKLAVAGSSAAPVGLSLAGMHGLASLKGFLATVAVVAVGVAGVLALRSEPNTPRLATPSALEKIAAAQAKSSAEHEPKNSPAPFASRAVAGTPDADPSLSQPGLVPIVASTPGVCSVSGRVVDEAGRPVAEARLFARSSPMSVASGATDNDGRFLIEGMESSDSFCMNAYTHFPGGKDFVATKIYGPLELSAAGLVDLVLVAYATGTITGSLVDQHGLPVPDVQLEFIPATCDAHYTCINVALEPSGRFTATGVPCETLGVYVYKHGASVPTDSWLERVTLAPRQQLSGLNLVYTGVEIPVLTGMVVDDKGAPVGGAKITDYAGGQEAQSSTDGTFALRTANDSLSSIVVRHPDYQDAVPSEDERGNLKVVLHKANRLYGKVVSAATRQPVQSYRVLVHNGPLVQSDTIHWEKAVTVNDAEGKFDQPCSRDIVTALFRAEGFADFTVELNQADCKREIAIALPAAQTLKGFIVDPEGQPVQDARICVDLLPRGIRSYKTNEKPDARSGADGSFALERLAAGEHFVLADHIEYGPVYQTINVPQSEPVILALTQGCTLAGVYSGLPPHARCMLDVRQGQLMYREPCNEDGTYKIAGLPAGTATVRCEYRERHGGWSDGWELEKTVVFEDGKTTTLDFDWAGANAVVEGTVSFASAKDARLRAEVTGPDGSKLTTHVSVQPDGTFSIPRLFPGRVTLTATRIDQREVAEEISATVDAVAEATVNCNLAPSTTGQ